MAAWTCLLYWPLGPYGEQIQATKVKHLGMDVLGRCGPRAPGIAPAGTVLLPWRGGNYVGLDGPLAALLLVGIPPVGDRNSRLHRIATASPRGYAWPQGMRRGRPIGGSSYYRCGLVEPKLPRGQWKGVGTAWQGLLSLSYLVSAKSSTWRPCRRRGSGTRYNCVLRSKVDEPGRTQLWCAAPGHRWHSARWRT